MSKRKREPSPSPPTKKHKTRDAVTTSTNDNNDRVSRIRLDRLQAKISQGTLSLQRALKIARGFERQKLGRRQKAAQAKGDAKGFERLNEEVRVLKQLDLESVAKRGLLGRLEKRKTVRDRVAGLWGDAAERNVGENGEGEKWREGRFGGGWKAGAESNVVARLMNSNPVKEVMPGVTRGVYEVLQLEDEKNPSVKKSRKVEMRKSSSSSTTAIDRLRGRGADLNGDGHGHGHDRGMDLDGDEEACQTRNEGRPDRYIDDAANQTMIEHGDGLATVTCRSEDEDTARYDSRLASPSSSPSSISKMASEPDNEESTLRRIHSHTINRPRKPPNLSFSPISSFSPSSSPSSIWKMASEPDNEESTPRRIPSHTIGRPYIPPNLSFSPSSPSFSPSSITFSPSSLPFSPPSITFSPSSTTSIRTPQPTIPPTARTTHTTFLPSLTLGGYFSGSSDTDSTIDPTPANRHHSHTHTRKDGPLPPTRKNRRGQRARQQIAEMKYGRGARHLHTQPTPRQGAANRDSGWDRERGATLARDRRPGRKDDRRTGRRRAATATATVTGANDTVLGTTKTKTKTTTADNNRREVGGGRGYGDGDGDGKVRGVAKNERKKEKQGDDGKPLHPSWEAARTRKLQQQATRVALAAGFQGRKVVFD